MPLLDWLCHFGQKNMKQVSLVRTGKVSKYTDLVPKVTSNTSNSPVTAVWPQAGRSIVK